MDWRLVARLCTKDRDAELVSWLESHEPPLDLDLHDEVGQTVLHWAARCLCAESVHWLLLRGADPNARTFKGNTPLHSAAARKDGAPVMRMLLVAGARPNIRNNEHLTPLSRALHFENTLCTYTLVCVGALVPLAIEHDPAASETVGKHAWIKPLADGMQVALVFVGIRRFRRSMLDCQDRFIVRELVVAIRAALLDTVRLPEWLSHK